MLRQFLEGASLTELPLLAMGIFLAMFAVVLLRVCQRARSPQYRHMAELPLDDDATGRPLP